MIPEFDGAIILECTANNLNKHQTSEYIRPLAPFVLHELFLKYNIPSTVINYVNFWDPDEITETVTKWCKKTNVNHPLLLCSSLFNVFLLSGYGGNAAECIKKISDNINCKIILGGPVDFSRGECKIFTPYAVFKGRSLHMLEKWLLREDPEPGTVTTKDLIYYYQDISTKIKENPAVPILYDDYCLNHNDILSFETRLGCKFNCSFCSFEFRNAKKVNDSSYEQLHNFFNNAYSQFGIKYFTCADDTFNEDDTKLKNLHDVVSNLKFKPTIGGYNRFDLMMAKPEQTQILDEIGFHGHFFGFETFHRDASKLIKKGIQKEKAYSFLKNLKINYPHWFISGAFIVGLPLEPEEHFLEVIEDFRRERFVDSVLVTALSSKKYVENSRDQSDFFKNSEKYGLTLIDSKSPFQQDWEHSTMNSSRANYLASKILEDNHSLGLNAMCPWEWIGRKTLNNLDDCNNHISDYKHRKKIYIDTL
jgi:hypothetical protein